MIDINRIWGQRAQHPRVIQEREFPDIFSVRPQLALLNTSELPFVTPYMRMMLSTRLLYRQEYNQMRRQIEQLREQGNRFIAIGQMLLLRCDRIVQSPHQFPALLTTKELMQLLRVSGDLARYSNQADVLLGGGSAAAGAANAGRSYSVGARGSFAGAVVGYVSVLANTSAAHYSSFENAYKLELTRRGHYVR
jgi:hypothetical protein